ncbi:ABC transporter ATP-binding protein [Nesterenkonia populi]
MTTTPADSFTPEFTSAAVAEFRSVTQRFGDFTAVEGIDLTIGAGKLTTLLGPSGCGKTSSLRMLAGYARPSEGQIFIDGKDATRVPPEKRGLGMVFQSYALFPHMTVAENVGYGLKLRNVGRTERRAQVAQALEMVGLRHLADRKPRSLSGGQQQRVALARAITIRPTLLLLDEPLSNLDARLRVQMRSEIRRIQSETGLSVVLVTHDQDEALEMSDDIVVMNSGRIMQQGSPAEVFNAPANRFVAEFLGYENFLTSAEGRSLTVRPEHLMVASANTVTTAPEAPARSLILQGRVTHVAYRGVDTILTLAATDPSNEQVTMLAEIRGKEPGHHTPGDDVVLIAPAHRLVSLQSG